MAETLAAKVATFPANTSELAIVEALNRPDQALPVKKVKVPIPEARKILLLGNWWGKICLKVDDGAASPQVRELCQTVKDTMTHLTELDMDEPETLAVITGMTDGLVASGLLDAPSRTAFLALSDQQQSWADVNNGGVPVTVRDVGIARGGKAGV